MCLCAFVDLYYECISTFASCSCWARLSCILISVTLALQITTHIRLYHRHTHSYPTNALVWWPCV